MPAGVTTTDDDEAEWDGGRDGMADEELVEGVVMVAAAAAAGAAAACAWGWMLLLG